MKHTELVDRLGIGKEEATQTIKRWDKWIITATEKRDYKKHFRAMTKTNTDQLVTVLDMDVDLICQHHLLPIQAVVHFCYKPNGQIIGLSKIARIAQDIKTVGLQEFYTEEYVKIMGKGLKAKWAMGIVEAKHACMSCRGIKSRRSLTVTSAIYGKGNLNFKKEFMEIAKRSR